MQRLAAAGLATHWFQRKHAEQYRCLVINKRYDAETLAVAGQLKGSGTRIVLDLCDNRFVDAPATPEIAQGVERLRALVALSDQVVTATPTLAERVRKACPQAPAISVIGDLADDLSLIPADFRQKLQALQARLAASVKLAGARTRGRLGLVWFGNHGSPYGDGGMSDLLRVRQALEDLNREHPLFLSILSNNRAKFDALFGDWSIPTRYFEWHPLAFEALLQQHAVSLIPITPNDFTACKTDNRVVTAFDAGLAVVADAIPSYLPYQAAIPLGNWQDGLRAYLQSRALREQHVAEGRKIAARLNDPETITRKWIEVLHV
ncbi:MAG TPA: hypothetical protein VLI06_17830 [Solimonas sp.]|nr:hypothetical protein [Solimonas sp.]